MGLGSRTVNCACTLLQHHAEYSIVSSTLIKAVNVTAAIRKVLNTFPPIIFTSVLTVLDCSGYCKRFGKDVTFIPLFLPRVVQSYIFGLNIVKIRIFDRPIR